MPFKDRWSQIPMSVDTPPIAATAARRKIKLGETTVIHVPSANRVRKTSRSRKKERTEPIVYDLDTGNSAKPTPRYFEDTFIDVDNGEVIVSPLKCLDMQSTVANLSVSIIQDVTEFFLRLHDSHSNKFFIVKPNKKIAALVVQNVKQKYRGKSCAQKNSFCARQVHQVSSRTSSAVATAATICLFVFFPVLGDQILAPKRGFGFMRHCCSRFLVFKRFCRYLRVSLRCQCGLHGIVVLHMPSGCSAFRIEHSCNHCRPRTLHVEERKLFGVPVDLKKDWCMIWIVITTRPRTRLTCGSSLGL